MDVSVELSMSRINDDGPNAESVHSKSFKNNTGNRGVKYAIGVIFLVIIIMNVVYVLAVYQLSYANNATCTTSSCLRSATFYVESMNRSVDPCEDFYQFACGNYGKALRWRNENPEHNILDDSSNVMFQLIADSMEKEINDSETHSLSQARRFYRSCMATDKMEALGLNPLLEILDKIGLPYLGYAHSPEQNTSDLPSVLAAVKKHINLDYLILTSVEVNPQNSTDNQIHLNIPFELDMTDILSDYGSSKTKEEIFFSNVCMEIANLQLNYSIPTFSEFQTEWFHINEFSRRLTHIKKVSNEVYKNVNDDYTTRMTLNQLQVFTDNITQVASKKFDWKKYFNILFMDVTNITLDFDTQEVQIENIQYFRHLFEMISNAREEQSAINLWWKVIETLLPHTTHRMRSIIDIRKGNTSFKNSLRSLDCAREVYNMMKSAAIRSILDMKKIDRNNNTLVEMIENIRWALRKIVKDTEWIDETTKKNVLYKAEKMSLFNGYSIFLNNTSPFDNDYRDLDMVENDYFGNYVRCRKRQHSHALIKLKRFNESTIGNDELYEILYSNYPNYDPSLNKIYIPITSLQFPIYGHDLQVLNYGNLGFMIGQELTHGFGHRELIDQVGKLNDSSWTNQSIEEYKKRKQFFSKHYESYLLPGTNSKVNGTMTLDENISDNGGLREAFRAYQWYVEEHGQEPKLPAVEEYTHEQIFFLAYANSHCDTLPPSVRDLHSPSYLRVIAVLSNSEEFSNVWKCKKGTRMNPTEKFRIW